MMSRAKNSPAAEAEAAYEWFTVPPLPLTDVEEEQRWLLRLRNAAFSCMLWLAIALHLMIVIRSVILLGVLPNPDTAILLFLGLCQYLLHRAPEQSSRLGWLVMFAFMFNALDAMIPIPESLVDPTFLLIPLMVLFAASIGDPKLSMFAMSFVLINYSVAWWAHHPLNHTEVKQLTNLFMVVLVNGIAAFGIWLTYERLLKELRRRAQNIEHQLENNLRLTAVMYHDISNPLSALNGFHELALAEGSANTSDLQRMHHLSSRITRIIQSVRKFSDEGGNKLELEPVHVQELFDEVSEVMALRLQQKEQTLVLNTVEDHVLLTDRNVLVNSVMSNLVTNAHKFSPRGSTITLRVRQTHSALRIEVRNEGEGFQAQALDDLRHGRPIESQLGTEQEAGTGYGLRIIALYTERLRGHLEACNLREGGSAIALVLSRRVIVPSPAV